MKLPDIMVVCTANVARSPLFAALLQAHADQRLAPGVVTVGSAGLDARVGGSAAEGSSRVARKQGLSLDGHRSRPFRFSSQDGVAMVITMTRRQRRVIVGGNPGLASCTFALRELVVALDDAGEAWRAAAEGATSAKDRILAVGGIADGCRPRSWLRRGLDVRDPIGASQQVYDAMGEEFSEAASTLADALFGPEPT